MSVSGWFLTNKMLLFCFKYWLESTAPNTKNVNKTPKSMQSSIQKIPMLGFSFSLRFIYLFYKRLHILRRSSCDKMLPITLRHPSNPSSVSTSVLLEAIPESHTTRVHTGGLPIKLHFYLLYPFCFCYPYNTREIKTHDRSDKQQPGVCTMQTWQAQRHRDRH